MLRLFASLALILALSTAVHAKFVDAPAVYNSSQSGFLGDIESRAPFSGVYVDSDKVTHGHEYTHYINSQLRQKYGGTGRVQGLYVLGGKACIIPEIEGLTLRAVANAVPQDQRGRIYSLYMVQQQRWWNNEPSYVLDELVAYYNGARVGHQRNMDRRTRESFNNCLEMWRYALVLQKLAKQQNGYDTTDLDEFLDEFYRHRIVPFQKILGNVNDVVLPELPREEKYALEGKDRYE